MNKQVKSSLGLGFLLLLASCATIPTAPPPPPPPPPVEPIVQTVDPSRTPTEKQVADCAKRGGSLIRGGMRGAYHCVVKFADGGKTCDDKSQCQGQCVSYRFDHHYGQKGTGICQYNSSPFGCYATVTNGEVGGVRCVD
jgi:hypothetical protein